MIDRASARLGMAALAACVTACNDPSITVHAFRASTQQSVAVQPCDGGCGATSVFDGTGTTLERTVGFYIQSSSDLVTLEWTTSDAQATRCDAFTVAYGGSPLSFDLHLSSTTPAVIDGCAAPTCSTPVACVPFVPDGGGPDGGGTDAGGTDGGSQTDAGLNDAGGGDGGSMDAGACTQGPPSMWNDETVNTDQGFVGAWTASTGDIWAVAALRDAGSVWHYAPAVGWTHVLALDSNITYSSVTGTSPSDIWIAGTYNPTTNPSYPIILRGDGGSWTDAGPDATLPSVVNGVFSALWAASPDDVWVAGAQHAGNPSMFHWNGSQWLDESATLTVSEPLLAMAGTNASDIWAVGGMTNGEVEHRVGTAWVGVAGNFPNQVLLSVAARDGLAWAGASTPTTEVTDVFDWDGGAWGPDTRVTTAFQGNDASSIWASGPSDVWVGLYASVGQFDGVMWQTYVPSTCNALSGVYAITGTCTDLWFLGAYGEICHMSR